MVFSWLYKSNKKNTQQVILTKRTYKIQRGLLLSVKHQLFTELCRLCVHVIVDWELIRSAHDIENEVDFVDDNDTISGFILSNKDRKEYGCMEVEGGQIMDTISDEISEEINEYNFASTTPITPLSLSALLRMNMIMKRSTTTTITTNGI